MGGLSDRARKMKPEERPATTEVISKVYQTDDHSVKTHVG
jgi:hypothetical protein